MSIETHIVTDDPGPYQIRLIVSPPVISPEDEEEYVVCIYTRDESGYETGVNVDANDAKRLVRAIAEQVRAAGHDVALW